MLVRLALLAVLLLAACGSSGRSGVPGDRLVTELSDADLRTMCEWVADRSTDIDTSICSEPEDRELPLDECIALFGDVLRTCPATVETVEDCFDGQVQNPCGVVDACEVFNACFDLP